MITTHKIKLDFNLQDTIPRIRAVQGDQYSRMVEISLHSNTAPWMIPENTTVLIRYRKPNRSIGVYDTLPNGESAFQTNDNVITMAIAPDLLTVPGDVSMIVSLICGEQILSTFEMVLEVQANHNSSNSCMGASGYISGLLPSPRNAQAGQILAVDKIDGNGAVLATNTIDLPPYNSIQSISQDTEASTNLETVYNVNLSDGTQHSFTVKNGTDGLSGKSAYEYAKDAGYTGTEEEFSTKLTKGYPNTIVTEYGAKGDGVSNDTKAFQDALTENRVVFVPSGTYVLSGTLVIRENCGLELSQDTVLKFTQASGNCIEMRGSAVLRGNHGNIDVSGGFTGNVISVDTGLDGVVHASIPPYEKSTPMWKRQRFIYDVNITRTEGLFQASLTGGHSGTALYVSANYETTEPYDGTNTAPITCIWAMTVSGLRIGGAFDYGINIQNKDKTASGYGNADDPAWNHDMRIEAVIVGCETGVRVFNCNNAHLDVSIQPAHSINKVNGSYVNYAKNGIILEHSRNIDLSQSAVWDWNSDNTLVDESERNTHIALIGDCRGTILSDFRLIEIPQLDIRKDIYTDTPSNFDTMTILQEPANKWFKNRDGVPYFFNGTSEKQIALAEDVAIDSFFNTGKIAGFTNVLETAIDENGNIYGTKDGYYDSQFKTLVDDGYHKHTGFIACKKGDTFITDGVKLRDDGNVRVTLFDSSFNYITHANAGNMMNAGSYYFSYTGTDNGFRFTLKNLNDATVNKFAYARFNFHNYDLGEEPVMTVNEEIKYVQAGFLSDDIKVKAENVVGSTGSGIDITAKVGQTIIVKAVDKNNKPTKWEAVDFPTGDGDMSSWNDLTDKPFGESDNAVLLPKTPFAYNSYYGMPMIDGRLELSIGETYTVNWNGVDYACESFEGAFNGMPLVCLGNPVALGGTNNGLPFAVGCLDGAIAAIPLDGSTSVTVGITGYGVVPMPAKYKNEYHLKRTVDKTETGTTTYYQTEGNVTYAEYVLQNGGSLFLDVTYRHSSGKEMLYIMPLLAYGKDLRGFEAPDTAFHFDPDSGCNCLIFAGCDLVGDPYMVLCPQANGIYL